MQNKDLNQDQDQYIQYIFIGSNVNEDIMSILDSIKNKSFYDTLDYLSKNKIASKDPDRLN
jgi:hypothetical protein